MRLSSRWPLPSILLLTALYVLAGRLGLGLDAVSGFATLVWAPTGISLAALLIYGVRLWPGVLLGALAVNLWAGAAIPVAAGIALGNTLEAVLATYGLKRIPGFSPALQRLRDVLGLIVIGAALSTTVSATIGTLSLLFGGVVTPARFAVTWQAWWVGDAVADLIVAPLLLAWFAVRSHGLRRNRAIEAAGLGFCVAVASSLIFFTTPHYTFTFLQPYLLSPLLIWAALRFQVRGAASATFIVSVIAVWGTAEGLGPFTGNVLHMRLAALQALMAIMALTFLILGAVAAERATAERDLTIAKESAETASRAKSRFLAVVSHELRTPLAGIVGYSDLLLENIGGELSAAHHGYAARIRAAAWHLGSVIEGILTFARGEVEPSGLSIEFTDARSLLQETVDLLEPEISAKHLRLRINTPDDAPIFVRADRGKARQILVNLVGNAVKFTNRGLIELQLRRENNHVTFAVTDTGPGIPAEHLDRIFEPFTQLPSSDSHLRGGTGLGLAISRMLAEALGGTVSVVSSVGEGSTFTLILPAAPSQAEKPEE